MIPILIRIPILTNQMAPIRILIMKKKKLHLTSNKQNIQNLILINPTMNLFVLFVEQHHHSFKLVIMNLNF